MKIFKLSLSALLLASLFISCDKGNDNPPAPKGGEGSFKGVVFAAGITLIPKAMVAMSICKRYPVCCQALTATQTLFPLDLAQHLS